MAGDAAHEADGVLGTPGSAITTAVRAAREAGDATAVVAALHCVDPGELAEFFHVRLEDTDRAPIGEGLPASPGAASGEIVLSADDAVAAAEAGRRVVLVRSETTPDDVHGMQTAQGILTSRGGMVSHAAVVARGWGIPAVVGAPDLRIDESTVTIGSVTLRAGDTITLDGSTGRIYAGELTTRTSRPPPELDTLLAWADAIAHGHVRVRVNADTAGDATRGRRLGAQGVGLCRTEHMFLSAERLPLVRRFVLSDDPTTEAAALAELEAAQTADFEQLLAAMDDLPVTVRLLDPPLHEFLPDLFDLVAREASGDLTDDELAELATVRRLHETNPMIGTRGVRLGVLRPGLYQMQVRALCTAAAALFERGRHPHVQIMIPLVVDPEELRLARSWVVEALDAIGHPELDAAVVTVGAMIETPRAALVAGELARHADFFSFGTNDLTQMTYAFSRDDVESRLLPAYQALGILPANPFAVLDQPGVGELIRIASEAARAARPDIELGVCGEHAGHPASADFLVRLGVDSVSCSPFRVPMARLAVAQALLASGRVHVADVELDVDIELDADPATMRREPADEPDTTVDGATVLHTLRVRGFVTPDGFVESIGARPAAILADLVERGLVRHVEARDMYALLPRGREQHEALIDQLAPPEVRAGLATHYERFLALNDEIKSLCTDWQVRGGEPNDHTDARYDGDCVERLQDLTSAACAVLDDMAEALPRLVRYRRRLSAAAAAVAAGDTTKFTGVMCGSFHDVWMELHEDLLVLQRIDRTSEESF